MHTHALYRDSISLEEHLRTLHTHFQEAEPDLWRDGAGSRTIPIFIFSLDYPMPVLIDKYHQAKAMSDMYAAGEGGGCMGCMLITNSCDTLEM